MKEELTLKLVQIQLQFKFLHWQTFGDAKHRAYGGIYDSLGELIDKFVAGLVLYGHETKSLRLGHGDLRGSYVNFIKGELWLINSYIAPYPNANLSDAYDPNRSRKLLLTSNEINKLMSAKQSKLSIVPTRLISNGRYIKLEIATARGLKKYDQREKIKEKIDRREAIKQQRSRKK